MPIRCQNCHYIYLDLPDPVPDYCPCCNHTACWWTFWQGEKEDLMIAQREVQEAQRAVLAAAEAAWDFKVKHQEDLIKILLAATQAAYRKHWLDDDSVGWHDLGDRLRNALCSVMGDYEFVAWLEQVKQ